MRILYLNAADNEGGAAKAATRLLHGVHEQGAEAALYVQRKYGADPLVFGPGAGFQRLMGFARPTLEERLLGISPKRRKGPFSAAFLPDGLLPKVEKFGPDLVHLHWVARMMRLETLSRLRVPIVWTMHDSWAFTGGCYLPNDCRHFCDSCGSCPVLGSSTENDLSRRIWRRKERAWKDLDLTVVAPSRWMAGQVRSSALFKNVRVEVIANGIDPRRYRPLDRTSARQHFNLPPDRKLVLYGAKGALTDPNKGFDLLRAALKELAQGPMRDRVELVVFGTSPSERAPESGFTTHCPGWQQDDASLARLYSAADLFVLPSRSENLPFTVMEAMACGTPCVGFDQGGVADLVEHRVTGYLAKPYDTSDLARGIRWVLEQDREALSGPALRKVNEEFSLERVALRHMSLYRDLINRT